MRTGNLPIIQLEKLGCVGLQGGTEFEREKLNHPSKWHRVWFEGKGFGHLERAEPALLRFLVRE